VPWHLVRVERLGGSPEGHEREGLLEEPPRRQSGYRAYPEEAVRRLRFIRGAKELGFTLLEVRELLTLWDESGEPCEAVHDRVREKLQDLERKIGALEELKEVLDGVSCGCRVSLSLGDGGCPPVALPRSAPP
jgi:MerR family mercuric resistance operon transcriptional regulator